MAELTDPTIVEVETEDMVDGDMLGGRQAATPGLARFTLGKLKAFLLASVRNVPAGGTAGQIVTKGADGTYDWANAPVAESELPALTGNEGKALIVSAGEEAVEWGTASGVPAGGLTGQVLTKLSDADYDATWVGSGDEPAEYVPVVVNQHTFSRYDTGMALNLPFVPTVGNMLLCIPTAGDDYTLGAGWSQTQSQRWYWQGRMSIVGKVVAEGDTPTIAPIVGGGYQCISVFEIDKLYIPELGVAGFVFDQIVESNSIAIAGYSEPTTVLLSHMRRNNPDTAWAAPVVDSTRSIGSGNVNRPGATGHFTPAVDAPATVNVGAGGDNPIIRSIVIPLKLPVEVEPLTDAPADGETYGRKDNEWVPVEAGGGGGGSGPSSVVGMRSVRLHNASYAVPADANHKVNLTIRAMGDADMADTANSRLVVPAGVNRARLDLSVITGNDRATGQDFYIFYFEHRSAAGVLKATVGAGGSEAVFFGYTNALAPPVEVEPGDYFELFAKIQQAQTPGAGAFRCGMQVWKEGLVEVNGSGASLVPIKGKVWSLGDMASISPPAGVRIADLTFIGPDGNAISTAGAVATASQVSSANGGAVPGNVLDGNPATFYRSELGSGVFVTVTFPNPVEVSEIRLTPSADNYGGTPSAATLSVDGSRYALIGFTSTQPGSQTPLGAVLPMMAVPGGAADDDVGTAFPVGPTMNQRFFRSDRGIEYFWNGTRWLSTQLFRHNFQSYTDLTNAQVGGNRQLHEAIPFKGQYDIWIDTFYTGALKTAGTWKFELYLDHINTTGNTYAHDLAGANNVYTDQRTVINKLQPATATRMVLVATVNNFGAFDASYTYRLVG